MTTLNELRETLENHAGQAPMDAGLLPGVRGRAASLRRRRRLLQGTAVAAAILVAAVTIPWVAARPRPHPPVVAPTPSRSASQTTVTLREGSKFRIMNRDSDKIEQYVRVHGKGDGDGLQVLAFDPGAFDPTALERGRPVEIGGPRAWYVASLHDLPGILQASPVLGWEDAATGTWLLVIGFGTAKQDGMIEVARDVRLGKLSEAVSPLSFGWVPAGLKVVQTSVEDGGTTPAAAFGFGFGAERGAVGWQLYDTPALPFQFDTTVKDEKKDWSNFEHDLKGMAPKVINGAQTWYLPRPNKIFTSNVTAGADMVVATATCQILLHVDDRTRITEADLDRMLGSATFQPCTSTKGWQPPAA